MSDTYITLPYRYLRHPKVRVNGIRAGQDLRYNGYCINALRNQKRHGINASNQYLPASLQEPGQLYLMKQLLGVTVIRDEIFNPVAVYLPISFIQTARGSRLLQEAMLTGHVPRILPIFSLNPDHHRLYEEMPQEVRDTQIQTLQTVLLTFYDLTILDSTEVRGNPDLLRLYVTPAVVQEGSSE